MTMTDNRPGWEQDLRSLHRLFESLKVTTKYEFDPDADVSKIYYTSVHFNFGDLSFFLNTYFFFSFLLPASF